MKLKSFLLIFLLAAPTAFTQDNTGYGVLDEKLNRLRAELEDLQFRQQKTEKAIESIQTDLKELRRNMGTAYTDDLKALEERIAAVDAARQKDKQIIVDELARQLAGMGTGGKPSKRHDPGAKEHVVQKGETLSGIARQYGVSVGDLKKVNNLTGDSLAVGQKLVIPAK